MLSVRSLLAHWPWLPADIRKAVRRLDQRDPYPVMEAVDILMHCAGVDLENACVLVGLDDLAPTSHTHPSRPY